MWVESCVDGSSRVWVDSSRVCVDRVWWLELWWLEPGGWSLVAGLESGTWWLEPGGWSLVAGAWWLEPGGWSLVAVEPGGGGLVAGVWWPEPGDWRAWWLEPGGAGVWGRDSSIRRFFRPMSRAWCLGSADHRRTCHSTAQHIMSARDCEPAMLATRHECHAGCGDGCSIHHHMGRNADLER